MGPFAGIYGRCMVGIAAREQLDIPAAMDTFREAYQTATASIGPHSHAARLAGTLLGELLCDTGEIDARIDEILAANADKVQQYRDGKQQLFGFFVGQVMKAMGGKANPQVVNEQLRAKLG